MINLCATSHKCHYARTKIFIKSKTGVAFVAFTVYQVRTIISNKDLWRATGQEDINKKLGKRKFRWIGHTLRKEDGEVPKAAVLWNPKEVGREEDLRLAGEDRSPKKWVEAGMNYGSWRMIDRNGKNS